MCVYECVWCQGLTWGCVNSSIECKSCVLSVCTDMLLCDSSPWALCRTWGLAFWMCVNVCLSV